MGGVGRRGVVGVIQRRQERNFRDEQNGAELVLVDLDHRRELHHPMVSFSEGGWGEPEPVRPGGYIMELFSRRR